jgi:hypothetical protein
VSKKVLDFVKSIPNVRKQLDEGYVLESIPNRYSFDPVVRLMRESEGRSLSTLFAVKVPKTKRKDVKLSRMELITLIRLEEEK